MVYFSKNMGKTKKWGKKTIKTSKNRPKIILLLTTHDNTHACLSLSKKKGYGIGSVLRLSKYYGHDDYDWSPGNIHFQYMFNMKKGSGIGISLDYTHSHYHTKDICFRYDEKGHFIGGYIKEGSNKTEWFTICAIYRGYWLVQNDYSLYSRYGVGMALAMGSDSGTYFVPVWSPLGMEFSNSKIKISMEFPSIGSYGVLNVGLKYLF